MQMSRLLDYIKTGKVYVIAEMSANHGGSLENALSIVRAAKKAGAACLKVQTYTADSMTLDCDKDYFRIKSGLWDGYRLFDLYKEAATPYEWQADIKAECDKVDINFLSTPFDNAAVDFLENLGVEFYKIASFELVDIPLIEYVASKGKPIIISCGMGTPEEISEAIEACYNKGNRDIILLKCTSEYPATPLDMNLLTIRDMKERFSLPVGLSDHSMGDVATTVAVAMGAVVIEKHLCLSRNIKNPDSEFSSEPLEFAKMVQNIEVASEMCGKVNYLQSEREKASMHFRRSLFACCDIKKGERFTKDNVKSIRPSNGANPKYYNKLLEKTAQKDLNFGEPVPVEWVK